MLKLKRLDWFVDVRTPRTKPQARWLKEAEHVEHDRWVECSTVNGSLVTAWMILMMIAQPRLAAMLWSGRTAMVGDSPRPDPHAHLSRLNRQTESASSAQRCSGFVNGDLHCERRRLRERHVGMKNTGMARDCGKDVEEIRAMGAVIG